MLSMALSETVVTIFVSTGEIRKSPKERTRVTESSAVYKTAVSSAEFTAESTIIALSLALGLLGAF